MNDTYFLKETLKLARKGLSWTFPNPLVGAVIVQNGTLIAKGYHKKVGAPHAEIEAISAALEHAQGSTLYITLEPCVHYGRTPPCTDAIIASGIKRVVCAIRDPNPIVHGKGITTLKKAGIAVKVGHLEKEARELNEAFFAFHEKKRPFIALKFAASLDGKIATKTGDSKWITSEKARAFARKLRAQYQAVLVGINTVLRDDPHLGLRQKGKRDPLRIILDPSLRIPLASEVLRDANILIATTSRASKKKMSELAKRGITILTFLGNNIPLANLLEELSKREIISILVEGGGETIGGFVDERLLDKVYAFHAPILIGGKDAISAVEGKGTEKIQNSLKLSHMRWKRIEDNILTIGYFAKP